MKQTQQPSLCIPWNWHVLHEYWAEIPIKEDFTSRLDFFSWIKISHQTENYKGKLQEDFQAVSGARNVICSEWETSHFFQAHSHIDQTTVSNIVFEYQYHVCAHVSVGVFMKGISAKSHSNVTFYNTPIFSKYFKYGKKLSSIINCLLRGSQETEIY